MTGEFPAGRMSLWPSPGPRSCLDAGCVRVRCRAAAIAGAHANNPTLMRQLVRSAYGHVVPSEHGPGLGHALVSSVALNLAEGTGRFGRDRLHHYRIAYGSCQEAKTTVEILVLSGNLFIRSLSFP